MGTLTYTYEELLAHRDAGVPEAALASLRKSADDIISKPTVKIIDNKLPRPSKNPHDYVSMGPYWWPNPDTPDGLPYVQRDGKVNPEASEAPRAGSVYSRVLKLALAAFYFGEERYSEYACRQLYDWFINPDTYITPHATYSQGIPGVCEGRGVGLIDFGNAYALFNAIGILEGLGAIKPELVSGIREWFVKFTDWMLTHEYGLSADNAPNNHGSWHDANVLATAVFTNRPALIKDICLGAYWSRIKSKIQPDGSQPHELQRTKALGYSFYNYTALLVISNIAERLGYTEYWGIDESRGECIMKKAVDFLTPYCLNPESCPYGELYPDKQKKSLVRAMASVLKRYADEEYTKISAEVISGDEEWLLEPVL